MSQKMITGVFGLATDGRGKFLLTLRNDPEQPKAHRKWQIPGGGMEYGESAETTMIRELQEEIKCTATILDPRPTVVLSMWSNDTPGELATHITLITYLVSIGDQIPQETAESLECRWFTIAEIASLDCLPQVKEIVASLSKIS